MELNEKILKLKEKRNAVILAHNYQRPEVQDIADYVGDSLGLSIEAAQTPAEVIVFCGVYFMAETAKIINPGKTVIIPDNEAGCPMADMITAEQLRALKRKHPQAKVLSYVNTTAEVKAETDLCCTSANAVKMVNQALKDQEEIIFVPDKHLAHYVSSKVGRKFILWEGFCPTHLKITAEDIKRKKEIYPQAEVIVHPECTLAAIERADHIFSTEGMCRYARETTATEFIIGTELGIIHRLKKENPSKSFYPASERAVCPNMKRTILEKVLWALEDMEYEVTVPEEIMLPARQSIQKMLDFSS